MLPSRTGVRAASLLSIIVLAACGGGGDAVPSATAQPLTLNGVVATPTSLAGGAVTVNYGSHVASGIVAGDNSFSVVVADYADSDFVSAKVRGTGATSDIELSSLLGSAGALKTAAGNDYVATVAEVPALALSALTTAQAGLIAVPDTSAKADNPVSPVQTDTALAAALDALDSIEALHLAVVLQQIIGVDRVDLPAGVSTTLDLARDATRRGPFIEARLAADPDAFRAAAEAFPDLFVNISAADIPQDWLFLNSSLYADLFHFNPNGTGTVEGVPTANGFEPVLHWQIVNNKVLRITLDNSRTRRQSRDLDQNGSPFDEGEEVSAVERTDYSIRLLRQRGDTSRRVALLNRIVSRTFPEHPELGEEIEPRVYLGHMIAPASLPQFTTATVAGSALAVDVPFADSFNVPHFLDTRGDVLRFSADGGGTANSYGAFNWNVSNGVLNVIFPNGVSAEYRRLGAFDALAQRVLTRFLLTEQDNNQSLLLAGLLVPVQPNVVLQESEIPGQYFSGGRGSESYLGAVYDVRFLLRANGSGSENVLINESFESTGRTYLSGPPHLEVTPVRWLAQDNQTLDIQYTSDQQTGEPGCNPSESSDCAIYMTREQRLLARSGNRLYTIETVAFEGVEDYSYSFVYFHDRGPLPAPTGKTVNDGPRPNAGSLRQTRFEVDAR